MLQRLKFHAIKTNVYEYSTYDQHVHQDSAHLRQNQGYKNLEEPVNLYSKNYCNQLRERERENCNQFMPFLHGQNLNIIAAR